MKVNRKSLKGCELSEKLLMLVVFQPTSLIFLVAYISGRDRWRFNEG